MSGSSRIHGSGGYAGTPGDQPSRSASLARFCRGRKRGDVVSGVFLRMEADNLGWALLEGEELLAHFPETWGEGGSCPLPGDRVFFRIEGLVPDVVLRMLQATDPLARIASLLPSRPMAQEAALYTVARDAFETLLSPCLIAEPGLFAAPDPVVRKTAFINCVASDAVLLGAFTETLARSWAMCRVASSAGLVFFQHMPWLCAGLTQVEVSLWQEGETPVLAGARLPSGDRMLLRGAMEHGEFRYNLSVSSPGGGVRTRPGSAAQSRPGAPEPFVDLVSRILAAAADSDALSVGRFLRQL